MQTKPLAQGVPVDKFLDGIKGMLSPKGIGMLIVILAVLVLMERFGAGPDEIANKLPA